MGDDSEAEVFGRGSIKLSLNVKGATKRYLLRDVLLVSRLRQSLVSDGTLFKTGFEFLFADDQVKIYKSCSLCATGSKVDSLHILSLNKIAEISLLVSLNTWHEHFGHAFHDGILYMHANNPVADLKV